MNLTSRISSTAFVRAFLCILVFVALACSSAQHSVAAIFTLSDDNSVAQFNTASSANHFNWLVDGVDQLAQQAFWYRIGNVPEQSVHQLPILLEGISDTNFDTSPDTLFVRYQNNDNTFRIETRYTLDGGAPGSGASDLAEQISISNLTASPLEFRFFQYADFDLAGAGGDRAVFTNVNAVQQFKGLANLTETVVTPAPSHREIALFPVTLNKLNDGLPTTLSDTPPIGNVSDPGDITWAFQWNFVLAPNSTYQISKDKHIVTGIPEPATGSLLGLAATLLLVQSRKRRAAVGSQRLV